MRVRDTKPTTFYVPVQVPVKLVSEVYGFIAARMGTEVEITDFEDLRIEEFPPPETNGTKRQRCAVEDRNGNRCQRTARHANRHSYVATGSTPDWS